MIENIYRLENPLIQMDIDLATGAVISLALPQTGWQILSRPEVGLSWRLMVPMAEKRNTIVWGQAQKPPAVQIRADRQEVVLRWEGVRTERGVSLAINVVQEIGLIGEQVRFATSIENHSPHIVENVYSPYLGDIQPPPGSDWFKLFMYNYGHADQLNLWPSFQNMRGYFGVDFPTLISGSSVGATPPHVPFVLLRGEQQGLYLGLAEPRYEVVAWIAELHPGYSESMTASVPEEAMIANQVVSTRFAAVHVPYIQPGETRSLTPIAIRGYQGNWHQGVDIYTAQRQQWMSTVQAPGWAGEPHAWQQVHINSPEDELRMPFRDLPQIGAECAQHGVKAIQLVGWNKGGQDRDNPSHSPDPRLGTFEDLKDAIRQIQAMGVKVILFSKFVWADRSTQKFREQLHRLAVKDPYGDYYVYGGYQYQTVTQLLDINTRRLIPMCFLSEEWLQVCETEFQKTLDLGADGILFDESSWHGPVLACFDQEHGHQYGANVFANDNRLIERFATHSLRTNPEFLFVGEACYDWNFAVYHMSYHRSESKEHIPLMRYLHPHVQLMTAVTGFNDRNMINQCLLYRYIISYEPFNFKGRLTDYPLTVAYGKQMDALRTELREFFWDGTFRDTKGVIVTADGKPHHPYSVYLHQETGQPGVVVANYEAKQAVTVQVQSEDGRPFSRYRLVDDPIWRTQKDGVLLPPRSAAVLI